MLAMQTCNYKGVGENLSDHPLDIFHGEFQRRLICTVFKWRFGFALAFAFALLINERWLLDADCASQADRL